MWKSEPPSPLQAASGALVNAVAVREHREAPYLGREIRWWLRGIQSAPAWDALTPDLLALLVHWRIWSSQQGVNRIADQR